MICCVLLEQSNSGIHSAVKGQLWESVWVRRRVEEDKLGLLGVVNRVEWAEESEMLSCQKVISDFSLRFFFMSLCLDKDIKGNLKKFRRLLPGSLDHHELDDWAPTQIIRPVLWVTSNTFIELSRYIWRSARALLKRTFLMSMTVFTQINGWKTLSAASIMQAGQWEK